VLGAIATAQGNDWLFAVDSSQNEFLRGIAAFCGVLLVGVAGATIDLGFVRARSRTVGLISLGALGLPLVSTFVLALTVGSRLFGPQAGRWTFAAYAGLALAVSAVPVIVKIFADLGVLHRHLSQLSLSVAVIDDAVVWIGLSIIALAVHLRHAGDLFGGVAFTIAAVVALALLTVVARRTGVMARSGIRREPGIGTSCLVAAGFITLGAVITDGIGLDSTLGAFLCGAVVGSGRIVPVAQLRPLRTVVLGVLAPLFLAINGLAADLTALRDPQLAVAAVAAVVLAVLSKTVGAYGGSRLAGLEHDAAMAVSSALNARGTVQLVVAATGVQLGLITRDGFSILVLVALVTSAMAGPLIRRYLRRIPETPDEGRRDQLVE
jgi:Kef-type K+ transport system membrane component KefB